MDVFGYMVNGRATAVVMLFRYYGTRYDIPYQIGESNSIFGFE